MLHRPLVKNSSECFLAFFSSIHWLFCESAVASNVIPPTNSSKPRKSVRVRAGRAARTVEGIAFSAITGIRQSDTHVACATKAPKNLGGEVLMLSKRESLPSPLIRLKRKVPTALLLEEVEIGRQQRTSCCPDRDGGA